MGTLLDHHLASFDAWLHAYFVAFDAAWPHYLTVITLLDQLNPGQFSWYQVSAILQRQSTPIHELSTLFKSFDGKELNIEFTRIVSKFLMDRDRARSLWINSHKYADLATNILKILGDK